MPERLDIDPELLRRLALQHDQVAAETREWAQPPSDWLANFEPTYGKIANPVKEALERYYTARLRAGEALAREHEETARSLRESADTYERTDAEGAAGLGDPDGETRGPDTMFGSPPPSVNGPPCIARVVSASVIAWSFRRGFASRARVTRLVRRMPRRIGPGEAPVALPTQ